MRNESGFTLIEIMIALVILMIGLTGVLGMSTMAIKAAADNDKWTTARIVAESTAEQFTAMPLDALQSYITANGASGTETVRVNNWDYQAHYWLERTGSLSTPVRVRVRVNYSTEAYAAPVSIVTMRSFYM